MIRGGKLPPEGLWSQYSLCPFSFPGGKCDPEDQDVIHTALRETQEELGLEVPKEHVWGALQPVYDRVSHPYPVTLCTLSEGVSQPCSGSRKACRVGCIDLGLNDKWEILGYYR